LRAGFSMSLKKSVIAVILQNLIGFVVGLGNSVLSTRVLGPEGKGIFAIYTSSVELFALILGFGIPSALLYFAAKDEFSKKRLFVTSILFLMLVSVLFWLIVKSSFAFGFDDFFLPAPFNGSWFIFTLVGYFFCLSGWHLLVAILNGHRLFVQTNLVSIVSISLTFIFYGILYYLINIAGRTFDVTVFYWIQLLVAALVLILCLLFYFRKVATPEPQGFAILNTAQSHYYRWLWVVILCVKQHDFSEC
jgi:O-antigen/teichoic acid export membrane protein